MVQSGNGPADDGGEIDRIIQEIENMEKDMDKVAAAPVAAPVAPPAPPEMSAMAADVTPEAAPEVVPDVVMETNVDSTFDSIVAEVEGKVAERKVVPIRESVSIRDSLAETDAVLAPHETLAFEKEALQGGLSLKVGGCATIALEFEQNGIRVSLRCEEETLTITTDAGAEFKVPLRRAAA